MVRAANELATVPAQLQICVLVHVVIESGVGTKRPAAVRAVELWLEFVMVAEHGKES